MLSSGKQKLAISIGLFLLAFGILTPPGRAVLFLILPLGSGWDDLLFIGLLCAGVLYYILYGAELKREWEMTRWLFWLVLGGTLLIALLLALLFL